MPISHTRDTAGPMARSVADCALLDGVVTGGATDARRRAPQGPAPRRAARAFLGQPRRRTRRRLLEDALARLREAGAVLVEGDVADVGALDNAAGFPIALYETVTDLNRYLAEPRHRPRLSPGWSRRWRARTSKACLRACSARWRVPEAAYREALAMHRPALQDAYRRVFPRARRRGDRLPDDADAGRQDRRGRDGDGQRRRAVPTFFTYIRNTEPGQRRRHSRPQPAGRHDAQPGFRSASSSTGREGSDQRLLAIGLALETVLPKLPAPKL